MLHARAEAADEQGDHEEAEADARTRQAIPGSRERRAERQYRCGAEALGDQPGGNLETGHGAREQPAQQPEFGVAEPELLLPDGQHDVDQIGVAVMQRMPAAGDAGGAALVALGRERRRLTQPLAGGAHDACGSRLLRSTKALLMNEITDSPRWFTPTLRTTMMPQPGRLFKGRISTTSVAYAIVSPARTGLGHLRSRNPGEGPSGATASPRARRSSSSRRRYLIISRIQTQAVCQPEAQSPPNCERAPAASSRWKGCGSKRAANALISSAVKGGRPMSLLSPTRMSSKNFMTRSAALLAPHRQRVARTSD